MGAQDKATRARPVAMEENRVFQIPVHIWAVMEAEAADLDMNNKEFLRRLLRWHGGVGPGRPPGARTHKFAPAPPRGTPRAKTSLRAPLAQLNHLQKLAEETGLPYSSLIVVLFFRWLDIDPLEPVAPVTRP